MSMKETAYGGILMNEPADPDAVPGYSELVDAWESMANALNAGRSFSSQDFRVLLKTARQSMTARERMFFDKPFDPEVEGYEDLFQAKVTGRMTKVLMDRHGYKVPKEGGGLG